MTYEYYMSVTSELHALNDRIGRLMKDQASSRASKVSFLRNILKRHVPENLQVGRGFVVTPDRCSYQIDILIYDKSCPLLYRDGDLVFVTPDAAAAIIEVLPEIPNDPRLVQILAKLSQNAEIVNSSPSYYPVSFRGNKPADPESKNNCFVGLFSFESKIENTVQVLAYLKRAAMANKSRIITHTALGRSFFYKYWQYSPRDQMEINCWEGYNLEQMSQFTGIHRDFARAHTYFFNSLISYLSPERTFSVYQSWFPIEGERQYKIGRAYLDDSPTRDKSRNPQQTFEPNPNLAIQNKFENKEEIELTNTNAYPNGSVYPNVYSDNQRREVHPVWNQESEESTFKKKREYASFIDQDQQAQEGTLDLEAMETERKRREKEERQAKEARQRREEEERRAEEARKEREAEAQRREEASIKRREEEERRAEVARKRREEEERKAEEARKRRMAEEEKRQQEEKKLKARAKVARIREEKARSKQEEEDRQRAEENRKRKEAIELKRSQEEVKRMAEAARKQREEEERKTIAARKLRKEEERKAEEARKRREEEDRKSEEEQERKVVAARKLRMEEARRRLKEESRKKEQQQKSVVIENENLPARVGVNSTEINRQDLEGNTALHRAAAMGSVEEIVSLIDSGADVNIKNRSGNTPLHLASATNNTDVSELLLISKADVKAVNYDRNSPLHMAAINNNAEMVDMLMDNGADIDVKNNNQLTPLHQATLEGSVTAAETLIKRRAEIHARAQLELTPLHLAALTGDVDSAHLLIVAGADVNAQAVDGNTPLHCAASRGHVKVIKLLIRSRADMSLANSRQKTYLDNVEIGYKPEDMAIRGLKLLN